MVLAAAALAGCLERTMTITSQPTGALVYVSSVEVGRTPVRMPFTFYGTYEVVLAMDGYETLNVGWPVYPPLYDVPPLDLLTEIVPWTYHVNRQAHFTLEKAKPVTDAELLRRAGVLRQSAVGGGE